MFLWCSRRCRPTSLGRKLIGRVRRMIVIKLLLSNLFMKLSGLNAISPLSVASNRVSSKVVRLTTRLILTLWLPMLSRRCRTCWSCWLSYVSSLSAPSRSCSPCALRPTMNLIIFNVFVVVSLSGLVRMLVRSRTICWVRLLRSSTRVGNGLVVSAKCRSRYWPWFRQLIRAH